MDLPRSGELFLILKSCILVHRVFRVHRVPDTTLTQRGIGYPIPRVIRYHAMNDDDEQPSIYLILDTILSNTLEIHLIFAAN